ncbi:PqqD family protein [Actinoplanes sp. NPDC051494]|uniref:PqqD family protein n=1 Tax=Actinoplanes sp. NPDC051494 TaxID=3363907 RepID=UPI003798F335
MTAGTRRYKVRPDAFYVRRPDGARLSNNTGSFTIRGAGAYRLVAAVLDALDGDRTLDEIVTELPAAARRSVLELVTTLDRNGFLTEVRHPGETVPDWLRRLYPAQLDFLELHADHPVARFHRARSAPVLLAGTGLALTALLAALTEFGLSRLHVLATKDDADTVDDVLAGATRRDAGLRCEVSYADPPDLGELTARARRSAAPMVLLAGDDLTAGPGAAAAIGRLWADLRADGRDLGVLGRCGDFTVALPGGPDDCWACLHRRLTAHAVATTAQPLPLAAAPATIAALHLAQHTFVTLAGATVPGFDRITTVEPVVPAVRTHQRRRHPRCDRHGPPPAAAPAREDDQVRPDVPAPENPPEPAAVADRIVTATTGWLDPVLGPLLALGEQDADQIPLAVSRCRVAEPHSTAMSPATVTVTCRALAPREARNQVVLATLEHLAGTLAAGALPAGWVIGAGWSRAEAHYRARLAAAAQATATGPVEHDDTTPHPVREFLTAELAARNVTWRQTGVHTTTTGFVRVTLHTGAGRVTGHGVDAGHAHDNALLRALGDDVAAGDAYTPAHLAPPHPTWTRALAALDATARPAPTRDLTPLLGFLDGHACLIATPGSRP